MKLIFSTLRLFLISNRSDCVVSVSFQIAFIFIHDGIGLPFTNLIWLVLSIRSAFDRILFVMIMTNKHIKQWWNAIEILRSSFGSSVRHIEHTTGITFFYTKIHMLHITEAFLVKRMVICPCSMLLSIGLTHTATWNSALIFRCHFLPRILSLSLFSCKACALALSFVLL